MASVQRFGYYIKGNKLALVEKDTAFDNDVNSKEYGPGSEYVQWKSPLEDSASGIELEYVYNSEYWIPGSLKKGWDTSTTNDESTNAYYTPAYGEIAGYLSLFFPAVDSAGVSQDMTAQSAFDSGEHILVKNHPRWNGLHKIQSRGAQGWIKTYTKWNSGLPRLEEDDGGNNPVFTASDNSLAIASDADFTHGFSAGDYVFQTTNVTEAGNEGLFKISSIKSDGTTIYFDGYQYVSDSTTNGELKAVTDAITDETFSGGDFYSVKALLSEGAYIVKGVNVLDNEEDTINIPSYLTKALVYYVKAKIAEDGMNIEAKEYFMSEFRKMVEKFNNTRVSGVRIQASGPQAIR